MVRVIRDPHPGYPDIRVRVPPTWGADVDVPAKPGGGRG